MCLCGGEEGKVNVREVGGVFVVYVFIVCTARSDDDGFVKRYILYIPNCILPKTV